MPVGEVEKRAKIAKMEPKEFLKTVINETDTMIEASKILGIHRNMIPRAMKRLNLEIRCVEKQKTLDKS